MEEYLHPPKTVSNNSKFNGISLKGFASDCDHGEVVEFLIKAGLPSDMNEKINFAKDGTIIVKDLENNICQHLIDNIHRNNLTKSSFLAMV